MATIKERAKKSYLKHRKSRIKKVMDRLKRTNYAYEKTPEARKWRTIKRETRRLYPINVLYNFCLCGKPATEHHHTTDPVTVDDFIFVCHNCHVLIDVRRERWKEKNWQKELSF